MKHLPEYVLMTVGFALMVVCGTLLMLTTNVNDGYRYLAGAFVGIGLVIGSVKLMGPSR